MTVIKLKIRSRMDELSPMTLFVTDSFVKNQTEFENFSPKYDDTYAATIEAKRKEIDALLYPVQLTAELKVITKRIYAGQDTVTKTIGLLEGYAQRATGLTIDPKDFGFAAVRASNHSGDIEGLVKNMRIVSANAKKNIAALTLVGYSAVKQAAYEALTDGLETNNAAQNSKEEDRRTLVSDNHVAINELWEMVRDLCDAGKRIYPSKTDVNRESFVVSTVLAKMRKDALKTAMSGTVPPSGKIVLKPMLGGRKRVINADPKGVYDKKGIKPGEYYATLYVKGVEVSSKDVKIETGVNLVENFGPIK